MRLFQFHILFKCSGDSIRKKLSQHELKNAAVTVVLNLVRRVDARNRFDGSGLTVITRHLDGQLLSRFQTRRNSTNIEFLKPGQAQRFCSLSRKVLQRQNPHSNEVAAMNPFVTFRQHRANAQQTRALGGPVA